MIETIAVLENLRDFVSKAKSCALNAGLSTKQADSVELAVEEVFVNICNHASKDGSPLTARLECRDDGDSVRFVISDKGLPFNPLAHPEPDIDAPIEERDVGGLGILLVKNMMDDTRYERRGDENILTLVARKKQ